MNIKPTAQADARTRMARNTTPHQLFPYVETPTSPHGEGNHPSDRMWNAARITSLAYTIYPLPRGTDERQHSAPI